MGDEFTVHRLNINGFAKAERVAFNFETLLQNVLGDVPPGRERAVMITKLQEACFWAKRGIALQPENQDPAVPA